VQQNPKESVSKEVKSLLRNKWETATRCLEVALHPNTSDDEVIAAVNGFRRTANGTPLRQVCIELAGGSYDGRGRVEWKEKFDRLNRENLDLRHDAEKRICELSDELLAAQRRAGAAEQRLADVRSTLDDLNHENLDLRRALEEARRVAAERQAKEATPPFRKFLDAARLRTDQGETVLTHHPTAPHRGRESIGAPTFSPNRHRPWTA